jgi:hypothetical protein
MTIGWYTISASSKDHLLIKLALRRNICQMEVFEMAELLDSNIPNNQLWRRRISEKGLPEDEATIADINTTSIVLWHSGQRLDGKWKDGSGKYQDHGLSVRDFWLKRDGEEATPCPGPT